MKTILIILLTLFLTSDLIYSQNFEWAQSIRSDGNFATPHDTETDYDGNIYVIGRFSYNSMTFGQPNGGNTITLPSNGSYSETFLAKYNSSGQVIWARNIGGGSAGCFGSQITCDNEGNSYVTGFFYNTINFENNISLTNNGTWDPYIAKYNNFGVCQWARLASGPGADHGISIDVDNSGNCYVAGTFYDTLSFISDISTTAGTVISNGSSDAFLAKYTSEGVFQWAVSGGSLGEDYRLFWSPYVLTVSVDTDGDAYLAGGVDSNNSYFSGRTDPLPRGAYFVKYNSDGVYLGGIADASEPYFVGIGIDSAKNVFTTGETTITKYDNKENRAWRKIIFATGNLFSIAAETDINGYSYISGQYQGTAYFPPYSILSSGVGDLFVAKIEPVHGDVLWVRSAGGPNGNDHTHGIAADTSENVYITGHFQGPFNFGSIVLTTEQPEDGFLAKISSQTNTITGKVYVDNFCNGPDESDPVFPEVIISSSSGNPVVSYNDGKYYSYCGTGIQSVSIQNPPRYYEILPTSSVSIDFGTKFGQTNSEAQNNFYLCPIPDKNDLTISLSNVVRARPGFKSIHYITYKNAGTTTLSSGNITLEFDSLLTNPNVTFSGNTLPYTISGNLITWSLSNLSPNQSGNIEIDYTLPANVPLGTQLSSIASIQSVQNDDNSGDETPLDNTFTLFQSVFGSYDPNDISVEPSGNISEENILNEDSLTYTIRFQNTGTDTAFTVVVTDSISENLNLASVETISASHDYRLRIIDGYKLAWTFDNILLPDSTTNEVESHGFVKYRIKPKNDLVIGDEITNSANIYFDFNEPVLTNTVVTRVSPPLKYIDLRFSLEAMYPNADTIKVYLANSIAPFQIVDSSIVLSQSDSSNFIALPSFANVVSGNPYYIIIKHRNSIETWSANPVAIISDTTTYDFTGAANMAFGNNLKLVGDKYCIYSGDVNQDGIVDISDVNEIYNAGLNFSTGYLNTDLTGNGVVDISDVSVAYNNGILFIGVIKP